MLSFINEFSLIIRNGPLLDYNNSKGDLNFSILIHSLLFLFSEILNQNYYILSLKMD